MASPAKEAAPPPPAANNPEKPPQTPSSDASRAAPSNPTADASKQQKSPYPTAAADDVTLIRLLSADLERMKALDKDHKADSELKHRDETRIAIMLRLAQEQIENGKVHLADLRSRLDEAEVKAESLSHESESKERRIRELEEQSKAVALSHQRTLRENTNQLDLAKSQREILEAAVQSLREDLEQAKSSGVVLLKQKEALDRKLHETTVMNDVRIKSLEEENKFLTETRDKEAATALERELSQSRSIAQLKAERDSAQKRWDVEYKRFIEDLSAANARAAQLEQQCARSDAMVRVSDKDNFEKIARLTLELQNTKDRAEKEYLAAKGVERDLQQQTAKLVADLRVAQEEINRLADRDTDDHKQRIQTLVELRTVKETLQNRIVALEAEAEKKRVNTAAREVELSTQIELLNQRIAAMEREKVADVARLRDEILRAKADAAAVSTLLESAEKRCAAVQDTLDQATVTHLKEVAALKAERDGYQATVAKLEQHMRDDLVSKILQDEVDSLRTQNTRLKNQLTHANSALANLRVDADISEQYRERLLQEQVAQLQSKIGVLERERRFARPLLRDVLIAAHGGRTGTERLDPALEKDLDHFVRNFGEL